MLINGKLYTSINNFDVIDDSQFFAVTNYGVVLFDTTMSYDGQKFTTSQDAVAFIESTIN